MTPQPRIAVVTGGGSGIGAASATALARSGWTVVITGRRIDALRAVAAAHPDLGIEPVATDVTDERSVRELFATVVERHGRLDLLFNNAGRGGSVADPDEVDLAEWRAVVDLNITGTFLCTREAFRIMRNQSPRGGRIINNGSIAAHAPRPKSVAYTTTKHAITGLTRSTQLDGRPYDIACGQIDIGNAATDMAAGSATGALQPDGTIRPEPLMSVASVGEAVVYMAGLPLSANVATMTVMATAMPYVGRG
jgi:NAD(P)-dependent dehydrogenase (short-subunit alcohol dehydrogenase family)